jgi:hypothetical protein
MTIKTIEFEHPLVNHDHDSLKNALRSPTNKVTSYKEYNGSIEVFKDAGRARYLLEVIRDAKTGNHIGELTVVPNQEDGGVLVIGNGVRKLMGEETVIQVNEDHRLYEVLHRDTIDSTQPLTCYGVIIYQRDND